MSIAPASGGEYEFKDSENAVIGDLASKMRFVSVTGIVVGVLLALAGIAGIVFDKSAGASVANVVAGVLATLVGIWTRSAAEGFQRIVDTRGHDIANLMAALGELRRVYALQRILFIGALVSLVLTAQLALLFMLAK